jgi:hypothetical protein
MTEFDNAGPLGHAATRSPGPGRPRRSSRPNRAAGDVVAARSKPFGRDADNDCPDPPAPAMDMDAASLEGSPRRFDPRCGLSASDIQADLTPSSVARSLILVVVRWFAQGFNCGPLSVVGLVEIQPNHVHKPFPSSAASHRRRRAKPVDHARLQ